MDNITQYFISKICGKQLLSELASDLMECNNGLRKFINMDLFIESSCFDDMIKYVDKLGHRLNYLFAMQN